MLQHTFNLTVLDPARMMALQRNEWLNVGVCPECGEWAFTTQDVWKANCDHCLSVVCLEPMWEAVWSEKEQRTIWWNGPHSGETLIVRIPTD